MFLVTNENMGLCLCMQEVYMIIYNLRRNMTTYKEASSHPSSTINTEASSQKRDQLSCYFIETYSVLVNCKISRTKKKHYHCKHLVVLLVNYANNFGTLCLLLKIHLGKSLTYDVLWMQSNSVLCQKYEANFGKIGGVAQKI